MSFRHQENIYITRSGSSFGSLTIEDFTLITLSGEVIKGSKPSKEYPLHLDLYKQKQDVNAVLHTHGTYAVLWSMLDHDNPNDCIPNNTPYLAMRVGTIGLVDYYSPGSKELFKAFSKQIPLSDGYILKNHGAVLTGKDIQNAFYNAEELEESAKIAWKFKFKS